MAPELWDMHVLRQVADESMGGAVFSDHQDRHAEEKHNKELIWTVRSCIRL